MFDNVLVRDWMTRSVITVTPETSISSAHQTMKEHGIRRLPVLQEDKLVGIVTIFKIASSRFLGTYGLYIVSGVAVIALVVILWGFFRRDPNDGVGVKLN